MPKRGAKLVGVEEAIRRVYTKKGELARGMARGITKATLFLLRKSQQVVPVDTGALRASGFAEIMGAGFRTQGRVGYTMSYAIFVHENLEARHRPGKQAKYLSGPAKKFRNKMVQIMRDEAQKG